MMVLTAEKTRRTTQLKTSWASSCSGVTGARAELLSFSATIGPPRTMTVCVSRARNLVR